MASIGNMHLVPTLLNSLNHQVSRSRYTFTKPGVYGDLKFESESYLIEGCAAIDGLGARIGVNTLESEESANYDTRGLWRRLIDMGISMIQTGYLRELLNYLDSR